MADPERASMSARVGMVSGLAALAVAIAAFAMAAGWIPGRKDAATGVRDYILAHPEILVEAGQRLHEKEMSKVVNANRRELETPFGNAWAGAEDGDVTLVEFFDYACGFCRASNPDLQRLLQEDPKLKIVWREFPVLGQDSLAAARVSLAAASGGQFKAFHDRMFASGRPTQQSILAAQQSLGVEVQQPRKFDAELEKNMELARAIGATGTPTFVIGNKVLQGAVGYDVLKKAIAEARRT